MLDTFELWEIDRKTVATRLGIESFSVEEQAPILDTFMKSVTSSLIEATLLLVPEDMVLDVANVMVRQPEAIETLLAPYVEDYGVFLRTTIDDAVEKAITGFLS